MDLQNILNDFFKRNGSLFTLDNGLDNPVFYGRLTPCQNKANSDNDLLLPMGKSTSKEYELVFSGEISGFKKGSILKSADKTFYTAMVNEYPLNGKVLYCHAFLHELGGVL